ncbi:hypothetical protein BPC006_II2616 [Burkholderia pseudomallei BPC006]|uniref:Uncharacterized protein n=1 Tax=Burkholderia pseudomallei 1710a TaxID=320371 RepID=A0A0E1VSW1_BURPE|nr:hypothetical protein BMASAVP1_1288 [Burkholderia mallei SAVP1]ABN86421.1 hypothetical protein BURPS668_A2795 [Burkholderia pseudomallei 668]AFR20541.1 hypothetical protein BPC006_II2616 [Burkholderia pseudomallei BPC006]EDO89265.1 hypothetical protein BURPSPAST_AC0268 [Burkholderia pseudomallei Pasteur 52237]EDP87052.1 hypothetical protein BMA10399_B1490 [Burkholderia mallei ATCC 10399]EDU12263.1 hypothetical protein BURPS1655_D1145 [Burkholderia pseudomallei 1655]EEP49924.1 conserved hypo
MYPSGFLRLALRGRAHDEARQPMRPAVREAATRASPLPARFDRMRRRSLTRPL